MSPFRRGACPTLAEPMATGDGLLVRLRLARRRLTAGQLAGIAVAARTHGNGMIEISARGNLQLRGLTPQTVEPLAESLGGLGIEDEAGLVVETGPLAGLDHSEIADPAPLSEAIRAASGTMGARLGPKVSVTVDGGGALPLGGVVADIALQATATGWLLRVGGAAFGPFATAQAEEQAVRLLGCLCDRGPRARLRDVSLGDLGLDAPICAPLERGIAQPVGRFALKGGAAARGLALPFGRIEAEPLERFAASFAAITELRLSPGRGLLVLGGADEVVLRGARSTGLVTDPADPRLSVSACAGAPACASALVPAREIAAQLAQGGLGHQIHVSGCEKGCAAPAAPRLMLVGRERGCDIRAEGIDIDQNTRTRLQGVLEGRQE